MNVLNAEDKFIASWLMFPRALQVDICVYSLWI